MINAYRKPRKKPVSKLGDDFVHKHLLAKGQPDSADVYTPAPLPAKGMKPKPKKRKKGKKK